MFDQDATKPIQSCFFHTETHLSFKRALLEIIASGKASTQEEIFSYIRSTFFSTCLTSNVDEQLLIDQCLQWLNENELIRTDDQTRFHPTQLALAVIHSALNPDEGLQLVVELNKAQRNLCIETDLHLIYLVRRKFIKKTSIVVFSSDHSFAADQLDFGHAGLERLSHGVAERGR